MNATPDQILEFAFLLAVFVGIAVIARRLSGGPGIAAGEVKRRLDAGEDLILLDVRTPAEFGEGHIAGAVNLPVQEIGARLKTIASQLTGHQDANVVVVCRSSARAHTAARSLRQAGLKRVLVMGGGMLAWQGRGFPVERGI